MNYRVGKTEDLDDICLLVRAAIEDMDKKGILQWDEIYPTKDDFENDIKDNTLYVLESDSELVAVYVINQNADEEYSKCSFSGTDKDACILHRLCISPLYQNNGLGRIILQHIENQTREMGYKSLRLDVFTKNPHAVNLYKKNDYIERGFADWRKGRFILMEKEL